MIPEGEAGIGSGEALGYDHPLRPLVLAVSIKLNSPTRLLAELDRLRMDTTGEHGRLAEMALQGARALVLADIELMGSADAAELALTEGFRLRMVEAGVALASVATCRWPAAREEAEWEPERKFRKACLDMSSGCFALSSGRLPRPDKPNLLTNITKAMPRLDHTAWTFYTLPDYGGEAPAKDGIE